jgi:hypothetical protein
MLGSIQLLGRHLLAEQMIAAFSHEGVTCQRYDDSSSLLRRGNPIDPVLLWTTDNRLACTSALRLKARRFAVHRYWIGGDVLRLSGTSALKRRVFVHAN